jgi:transcriptional regulator with XRE-family HTH domain
VTKDWDAVGAAIRSRLAEIDMTQVDLAARAGVALMTVRELQHNLKARRRNPRTLAAISEALGWPADHLARILDGQEVAPVDDDDPVLVELDAVKADLLAIVQRLDAIEDRLGIGDEPS